jgi:hypothetical protein
MLLPSKYEDLNSNLIVVGAYIIEILKRRPYNVEDLFQVLRNKYNINLEQYFNSITFLWLSDIVILNTFQISLVKK